jgi:hypothetical protein
VYHLELRKFPHTVCRFNQSEQQLRAVVVPWTNEEWIEEGERKWNSNEATITVLEGPKLSMPELAMGRGWRNAQRRSEDITERVLEAVKRERAPAPAPTPAGSQDASADGDEMRAETATAVERPDSRLLADSFALELLALLDTGALPLSRVWQFASERPCHAPAAESLALAEQAVRSLVGRGLVVLRSGGDEDAAELAGDRVEAGLRAVASWAGDQAGSLAIARRA